MKNGNGGWKRLAEQEIVKALLVASLLVVSQLVFNGFGVGGVALAASIYAVATISSSWYQVDSMSLMLGPNPDGDKDKSLFSYLTRLASNVSLVLGGLFLWMCIGTIMGVERANVPKSESPEEVMNRIAGDNIFLRITFCFISHFTLFSFCRFWVNFWELIYLLWTGKGVVG